MSVNLNTSHRIIPTQVNPSDYIKTVSVDADRLGVLELKDGKKFKISVSEISPNTLDQFTQKDWENVAQQTVAVLIKQGVLENFAGASFNSEGMRALSGEIILSQPDVAADLEEMVKDLLATKEKIEKVVPNVHDVVVPKEEPKKSLREIKTANWTSIGLKALAVVAVGGGLMASSMSAASSPIELLNDQLLRNAGAMIGGAALIADGFINRKTGCVSSMLSLVAGTALIGYASFIDRSASTIFENSWKEINRQEGGVDLIRCVKENDPFQCPLTALYQLDNVRHVQNELPYRFREKYGNVEFLVHQLSPFIRPYQNEYQTCFKKGNLNKTQVQELNNFPSWQLTVNGTAVNSTNATRFDCYRVDQASIEGNHGIGYGSGTRTGLNLCDNEMIQEGNEISRFMTKAIENEEALKALAEQQLKDWSPTKQLGKTHPICEQYFNETVDDLFGRTNPFESQDSRWGKDKGILSIFRRFFNS